MPFDLYLLATQGQFSPTGVITMPTGYFLIEEEIITPSRRPGGSAAGVGSKDQKKKKKKIKLKFFKEDKLEFEKEIIVSDVTVKVEDIKLNESKNMIEVRLRSNTEVVIKEIKL